MSAFSESIDSYISGVDVLRKAVAGMTREQLVARPIPGKWSTLEVVSHLADFEPILADRMKRIIALDRPTLMGADENLFAKELAYQQRDLQEELDMIAVTRSQMARILRSLPPTVKDRVGIHSERGPLTLEQILATSTRHIHHHIPFIEEKRKALA